MSQSPPQNPTSTLLTSILQTLLSNPDPQLLLPQLTALKTCILSNPNNYHHPQNGRISFPDIYEFVIECLSYQHARKEILEYLWHVLALIVRFWVQTTDNLKGLYEGAVGVVQQRGYCAEGVFRFFGVLVETMQEYGHRSSEGDGRNVSEKYSMIPGTRTTLENYFVYHMLNEMLAFSNIFLDRCVIRNYRNDPVTNAASDPQQQSQKSRIKLSQPCLRAGSRSSQQNSNTQYSTQQQQQPSQSQPELYTLTQSQPTILAILTLIRCCLSYDFAHTARYHQQAEYEPHRSPIILPTKYSKYCRFSEFDIFLKNENTTEMLNYLFLVSSGIGMKFEILRILQAMSRIHFRYFKNKTYHKLHLEDIGYVVANLLTGLDLTQPLTSSINGTLHKTLITRNNKVTIAVGLGELVSILLYHQPTFYIVEINLLEMVVEHVGAFVGEELLVGEYFEVEGQEEGEEGDEREQEESIRGSKRDQRLSHEDLCLLIENYLGQITRLSENVKMYLRSNDNILQKVNQLYVKIGQKYYEMLCRNVLRNSKSRQYYETNQQNLFEKSITGLDNSVIMQRSVREESSRKMCNGMTVSLRKTLGFDVNEGQIYEEETKTNGNPKLTNASYYQSAQKKQHQKNTKKHISFLLHLVRQKGQIYILRHLLTIFKVHCPQHTHLADLLADTRARLNKTYTPLSFQKSPNSNPLETSSKQTKKSVTISEKYQYQYGKFQEWMTSWLCNFENYFHTTSGNSRQGLRWELELHMQLIGELFEDLYGGLRRYCQQIQQGFQCKQNNQQINELGQVLLLILLYVSDKITHNCRIPAREYLHSINFNLRLIVQWLSYFISHSLKRQNKGHNNGNGNNNQNSDGDLNDDITIVGGIVEMLGGDCWSLGMMDGDRDVNRIESYCQVMINASFDKASKNKDRITIWSKVLYLLLKYQLTVQQQGQYKILRNLSKIFKYFSQSLYTVLQQMINDINSRPHFFRDNVKFFSIMGKHFDYNDNLSQEDQKLLQEMKDYAVQMDCILLLTDFERKMGYYCPQKARQKTKSCLTLIIQKLNNTSQSSSCSCTDLIPSTVKLANYFTHMSISTNIDTNKTYLSLFLQLISSIRKHSRCFQYVQLPTFRTIFTQLINIFYSFVPLLTIQMDLANKLQENQRWRDEGMIGDGGLFVVEGCGWMMEMVSKFREMYACGDWEILGLEREVVEIVMHGFGRGEEEGKGVLCQLEGLYKYYANAQSNQNENKEILEYITGQIQWLITKLLSFLLTKTYQKIQPLTPTSTPTTHPNPCLYLRVDNMITLFSSHTHYLESLYHSLPAQKLQQYLQLKNSHEILGYNEEAMWDCVRFLGERGVAWVVRKLEEWNCGERIKDCVQEEIERQKEREREREQQQEEQKRKQQHGHEHEDNRYEYEERDHQWNQQDPRTPQKKQSEGNQQLGQKQQQDLNNSFAKTKSHKSSLGKLQIIEQPSSSSQLQEHSSSFIQNQSRIQNQNENEAHKQPQNQKQIQDLNSKQEQNSSALTELISSTNVPNVEENCQLFQIKIHVNEVQDHNSNQNQDSFQWNDKEL